MKGASGSADELASPSQKSASWRPPDDQQLDPSGVCFPCENLQSTEKSFESVVLAGDAESQDLPSMLLDMVGDIKV